MTKAKEKLGSGSLAMPNAQDSLKVLKTHAEQPYSDVLDKIKQPHLVDRSILNDIKVILMVMK